MIRAALISTAIVAFSAAPVLAQDVQLSDAQMPDVQMTDVQMPDVQMTGVIATPAPSQDYCISVLSGIPTDEIVARYQFLRLTEELARDATPEFNATLTQYAGAPVPQGTPILDVIEDIANPVLRQAAPELVVANMKHLIDFAQICDAYISGQTASLSAYDPALAADDYLIQDDALYLRQTLSDSLFRLGADEDVVHGSTLAFYADSLVFTRDDIEFTSFESDIDDVEALYMTDLDGRLARSNDMINEEINRETLGDAVTLAEDMNKDMKRKSDQDALNTLLRILSRY